MKTVCEINKCAGCMACVEKCKVSAIKVVDSLESFNAVIDENKCINCNACRNVCPNNSLNTLHKPIKLVQGWRSDNEKRMLSSSGGAGLALAESFINSGGAVCACVYRKGEFRFEFAESVDEARKFVGSKYVKSNPAGIYQAIQKKIDNGIKVLFIGLPCQVAGVKNYIRDPYEDMLYTVDLICHGSPSPEILIRYLKKCGIPIEKTKNIVFRKKTIYKLYVDSQPVIPEGIQDLYTYAFLKGIDYTENCYSCRYAQINRVSDVTIGDSWGTSLSQEEQLKGISLLLVQSDKGKRLIESSDIKECTVDLQNAVAKNHQLNAPSEKPKRRDVFFQTLKAGRSFDYAMLKSYPKKYIKHKIKLYIYQGLKLR